MLMPNDSCFTLARALSGVTSKCWWGLCDFDVYSAGTTAPLPSGGGVYIFARPGSRGPEPVYIGETGCFAARLVASHEKVPAAERCGASEIHVWAMPYATKAERLDLERDLREQYQPVMNPLTPAMPWSRPPAHLRMPWYR